MASVQRVGWAGLLLVLGLAGQAASEEAAPDPATQRARSLTAARPLVRLEDVTRESAVCPDGAWAGAVLTDGRAQIIELATGDVVDTDDAREVRHTLAFAADGSHAWIGLDDGRVRRLDLGTRDVADAITIVPVDLGVNRPRPPIDGLEVARDGRVAWSSRRAGIGGVWDSDTKRPVISFRHVAAPQFGAATGPLVRFADGGRAVLVHIREDTGELRVVGRFGSTVLVDLETGRPRSSLPVYVTNETYGVVEAHAGLYYGTREHGSYQIRRFGFGDAKDTVLDPDARNVHFIDLFASPSGRWLAEGDFEDDGAKVYDLEGSLPPRVFGGDGVRPLAFDAGVGDLLFTTDVVDGSPQGVAVWDCRTGAKLAHPDWPREGRIELVESTCDGKHVILRRRHAPGRGQPVRRTLDVLRVP
ncbi:MAG: WD40 repeat domain-containing protein [Planctomycetota bacterium]|jgi:hypothetical protein